MANLIDLDPAIQAHYQSPIRTSTPANPTTPDQIPKMISTPEPKACTACAKARRKCSKQRPHCLRCLTRGIKCHYPPTKASQFVRIDTNESTTITSTTSPLDLHFPFLDDTLASWWFAAPSTWTIDASPGALPMRLTSADLDRPLFEVISWLRQWVETGSSPLMHNCMWRDCFPAPIRDAYLALSAYMHKTPLNAHVVHRVVEDSATQLVAQGLMADEDVTVNALHNLGRVQALLVYQCIGVYDGDVRLRRLVERHVPVLEAWVVVLMQQASQALCSGSPIFTAEGAEKTRNVPQRDHLWYTWILTESVRRLWLVIAGIQGLYKVLVMSSDVRLPAAAAACLGGTMFTSRKGFWEAKSASLWEKACTERYAGLVRLTETEKMFEMVPREEINEFAKLVLECTYGAETCETWGV
jgi:hypothetical protein